MKKDKENHPIDDLFVHKLGNLSLLPSKDGFERLQARMNQRAQQPKLVVWRNPVVQRYIAVAACLLVVCLFGWLYRHSASQSDSQVAIGHTQRSPINKKNSLESGFKEALAQTDQSSLSKTSSAKTPTDAAAKSEENHSTNSQLAQQKTEARSAKQVERPSIGSTSEAKPMLAQIHPVEANISSNQPVSSDVTTSLVAQRLAENNPKVNTPAERVLVVTIEEPAVLVAARQEKNNAADKVALTANEKDAKGSGLWQQVKRLKQGDLFARSDNATNDDQGLLSRAYLGLKQSFDKGKSTKQ